MNLTIAPWAQKSITVREITPEVVDMLNAIGYNISEIDGEHVLDHCSICHWPLTQSDEYDLDKDGRCVCVPCHRIMDEEDEDRDLEEIYAF